MKAQEMILGTGKSNQVSRYHKKGLMIWMGSQKLLKTRVMDSKSSLKSKNITNFTASLKQIKEHHLTKI